MIPELNANVLLDFQLHRDGAEVLGRLITLAQISLCKRSPRLESELKYCLPKKISDVYHTSNKVLKSSLQEKPNSEVKLLFLNFLQSKLFLFKRSELSTSILYLSPSCFERSLS